MKKLTTFLLFLLSTTFASAQIIATVQLKEPIPGLCGKVVYSLFSSFKGQEMAVCPLSKEQILARLNSEVNYTAQNPNHKDKCSVRLIINCEAEVILCELAGKSKSTELDQQIAAVFHSLGGWKAGKIDGAAVDSEVYYHLKIKKGKFLFD